jgi:CheY-like chemotaxis protein
MPTKSKRVLVVDNKDEESQVLASMLELAGYRPTTTWSGLEALKLLKSREFNIVLVSSYLPDLYVGDFFERFNRLPVRPCVIVMQEGQAFAEMLMKIKDLIGEGIHSEE